MVNITCKTELECLNMILEQCNCIPHTESLAISNLTFLVLIFCILCLMGVTFMCGRLRLFSNVVFSPLNRCDVAED